MRTVAQVLAFALLVCGGGRLCLAAGPAQAQNYPTKPIRLVVGGAGGGSDTTARLVGITISAALGQQVVVDNRPSGVIPGEIVSKATPDGYTLLVTGSSLWISQLLQSVPFDPVRDFAPVAMAASSPSVLTVHPGVAAKSVQELIALAKARPGELNYGTSGLGSAPHLAAELFKSMAGVNIVRINYRGAGAVINDLLAGQVQMTFSTTSSVVPHAKSGRLRALAVSSAQPSPLLPGLPTIAASGLPGYEAISPAAVFAPAGTPRAIIEKLNREIIQGLDKPDVREKFFNVGLVVAGGPPEALGVFVKSEIAKWGKLIKAAGIRAE